MACFPNLLLLCFVICIFVKDVVGQNNAQVQANDNAEQFALLCRIYNVAKNPPIHHVDLLDPNKIVEDIDALNASIADEKPLNETEQEGNSSVPHVKPTVTREEAVAKAILKRITQKAHNILEEIRKVNVTRDIENVKAEFYKVIFGDGMNESDLCNGALNGVGDRGKACGESGLTHKGESAGKNLVVDFFCLCAMRTKESNKEGIENVCGVYVGSSGKKGNHGWDTTCPKTSSTMWASIKNECGKHLHQHPKSTTEVQEVLRDFVRHLTLGGLYRWGETNSIKGSSRKAGMLGTGVAKEGEEVSGLLCDGSRGSKGTPARSSGGTSVNPAGICVYYGSIEWEDNIPWLRQLKTALTTVDALNNQTATIQHDIQKLNMLLHRAEEIYETTKVITEVQNQVGLTTLHNPTTKRLTAYNGARRHHPSHFILMFVLL